MASKTFVSEIIEEILSRVLVKSLLRFRCVSKSWCSLISSKRFIKTHLQNSIKNAIPFSDQDIISTDDRHLNLVHKKYFHFYGELHFTNHMDLENNEAEMAAKLFLEEYGNVFTGHSKSSWFVGCSNGLSCLFISEAIFLWNPCTRQSNVLPYGMSDCHYQVESLGFGFDEFNDDYKVLAKLSGHDKYARTIEYVLAVYSLKTNSWKILKKIVMGRINNYDSLDNLGKFLSGSLLDISGKLLDGKLHWGSHDETWRIFAFDLRSEVFGVVEQPSYVGTGDDWTYHSLEVVKECLCVLNYCREERWSDVWVLKEYGVKESWYKAFRFCHDQDNPHYPGIEPLHITEKLQILCLHNKTLIFYDPKTNSIRHPRRSNFNELHKGEIHVQSLVSPFPDGEVEGQNQIIC